MNADFIGPAYAYTDADTELDPVLKIEKGRVEMHSWRAKYIRSFALFRKTARIGISEAYQEGHWSGLLDGVATTVKRRGWADAFVRFTVNLHGAPPLQGKEYIKYRAEMDCETIFEDGLTVQLPTGHYLEDKLINLGSNRFTFRPQLGAVHTFGKWSFETTGPVAFYTDNKDFRPVVWASASAGYDFGGRFTMDGIEKNDHKQNVAWALSIGFPLNRHLGGKVITLASRAHESTGIDSDTIAIGLSA